MGISCLKISGSLYQKLFITSQIIMPVLIPISQWDRKWRYLQDIIHFDMWCFCRIHEWDSDLHVSCFSSNVQFDFNNCQCVSCLTALYFKNSPEHWASLLQWRHNERDSVSNPQRLHCLLNHLCGHRSKKPSKFRVTGFCAGNSPVTGEFSAQRASNAENVSIWWRHHAKKSHLLLHNYWTQCLSLHA